VPPPTAPRQHAARVQLGCDRPPADAPRAADVALIIRLLKPGGRAAVVLPDGSRFGEGIKTRLTEHLMEEGNLHTIVRLPNSVFHPYASIGTNLLFSRRANRRGISGTGSTACPRAKRPTP
jgi:type I restriction-modification system DNA methylase subunit